MLLYRKRSFRLATHCQPFPAFPAAADPALPRGRISVGPRFRHGSQVLLSAGEDLLRGRRPEAHRGILVAPAVNDVHAMTPRGAAEGDHLLIRRGERAGGEVVVVAA